MPTGRYDETAGIFPQAMDAFTQKFIEQYGDQIMTQLAKKISVHERHRIAMDAREYIKYKLAK